MISYKSSFYLKKKIDRLKAEGNKIGFIPTMGALHQGHISLIEEAKEECDFVVCSIFVNPTQFNNPEDLVKYPRTLKADSILLKEAKCDFLFLPSVKTMYPNGTAEFKAPEVGEIVNVLEGEHRPGHFEGVMQVVSLLLDHVNPSHLYMGLKDFQQFAICSKMVALQKRPIQMRGIPTVREKNGVAMSSRNARLSAPERNKASLIFETLKLIESEKDKLSSSQLKVLALQNLQKEKAFTIEYIEIVDKESLMPTSKQTNLIFLCAVWLGGVRLIDNMIL
jgi:pantoate--beta-alanine ligase